MNEDEIFYPLKGAEDYYEINKLGVIKSLPGGYIDLSGHKRVIKSKVMNQSTDKDGYWVVALKNMRGNIKWNNYRVHRLIAIQFIPNPDNLPVINHINAIRSDNSIDNLEWATVQRNNIHKFEMGYVHPYRRLSTIDVEDILLNTNIELGAYKRKGLLSTREMAKKYNISFGVLWRIIKRMSYKEVNIK